MISWQYRDSIGASTDLIPLFKTVLEHCKLKPGEQMLVYADHHTPPHYATAFLAAGQQLGADVLQITIPTQQPDVTKGAVWDAWHNVDLVIDLESISTSVYRPLRVSALAGGTRVLRGRAPASAPPASTRPPVAPPPWTKSLVAVPVPSVPRMVSPSGPRAGMSIRDGTDDDPAGHGPGDDR